MHRAKQYLGLAPYDKTHPNYMNPAAYERMVKKGGKNNTVKTLDKLRKG